MPENPTPFFPFYVGDWFISTAAMSKETKGHYIDLLAILWNQGPLSTDELNLILAPLAVIPRSAILKKLYEVEPNIWSQGRLERERGLAITRYEKATKGAAARWGDKEDVPKLSSGDAPGNPEQCSEDAQAYAPAMLDPMLEPCQSESESEEERRESESEGVRSARATLEWFVEAWNSIPGVKPAKLQKLTGAVLQRIQARLKEKTTKKYWEETFDIVRRSPFLCGEGREGWRADIEWVTGPKNLSKVHSGKYLDDHTRGNQADRIIHKMGDEHEPKPAPRIINP